MIVIERTRIPAFGSGSHLVFLVQVAGPKSAGNDPDQECESDPHRCHLLLLYRETFSLTKHSTVITWVLYPPFVRYVELLFQ